MVLDDEDPVAKPEHATIGLIGVPRDITERKQMESFGLQQSLILEMIAKKTRHCQRC